MGGALHDAEERLVLASAVRSQAALHPLQRSSHALTSELSRGGIGRTFVEGHDDVGAQAILDLDRAFGRELHRLAGDFVLKGRALVGNLDTRQREDLEAAAIGQYGTRPLHEFVQPAELLDQRLARTQCEMVGVGEHDLGAGFGDLGRSQRFERAVGADRHEGRGLYGAVRRFKASGSRVIAGPIQLEAKSSSRVSALDRRPPGRRLQGLVRDLSHGLFARPFVGLSAGHSRSVATAWQSAANRCESKGCASPATAGHPW